MPVTNYKNQKTGLDYSANQNYLPSQPVPPRGAFARSPCNVARVAMDACGVRWASVRRRNAAAYGEVVWTWRRDPGVYPACLCGPGNGGNKGRSPGGARSKPSNIGRGQPGVPAVLVVLARLLYAGGTPVRSGARDLRVLLAPGFPRALCSQTETRNGK